ncbi:MAG: phage portal protein [Dehalococcoidia bacterium]|jgi:hypothetical protein
MSDIFAEIAAQLRERAEGYTNNLNFYNGKHWPGAARRGERQLVVNYAKTNIEKVTSYLMNEMYVVLDPLTKETAKNAEAAEQDLNFIETDNDCEELDYNTERDAAIYGDGCYKVTWDIINKRVRITAPPVAGLALWSDPNNPNVITRLASQYLLPNGDTATEIWTDKAFVYYEKDQRVLGSMNPYGFIPFIHFPNLRKPGSTWGESDIETIQALQMEYNRAVSQVSKILELSGNPITVLEGVENADDIAVKPGEVWTLPEKAKAYLLDLLASGGINLHMDYIDMLYRSIQDTTETPKSAFGVTSSGQVTGPVLEIEMQPLVQRVKRKRRIRTTVYRRRAEMILALLKQFKGKHYPDIQPRISWGDILPGDFTADVNNEKTLVDKGIHSRKLAMENLGVEDTDAEFKQWLDERGAILRQQPPQPNGAKPKAGSDTNVSDSTPAAA